MEHLKERPWKLRPESVSLSAGLDSFEQELPVLQELTGLSPLTLRLCWQRNVRTPEEIQQFVNPRLEGLKDPLLIQDMFIAVDRLVDARDQGEKVRVFGDYDVDGTSGAALLSLILTDCAIANDVRQPDRFKDGYGLNVGAVEEAVEAGVQLLVTVDCGITSFDAIDRATELGLDVIVVDHHQIDPARGIPEAVAVLDPQRADCPSGLKELCGCGLAFYLGRALRSRGRELGWWPAGSEPNLKQHLDLVVIATAADIVPLVRDNHILVRHGMEVLNRSKKPGVRALLKEAGIAEREVSPGHLGFVLGPRINASGRMGTATTALELLMTQDELQAQSLARELERMNTERATIQNRIWDEVRIKVEAGLAEGRFQHAVVVADAGWHEGVVGIVASRVTETYRKPAAVIALREDFGKGSVRSYGGKDVLEGLRQAAGCLKGFGGHKHAAGLSLELDQVYVFAASFDAAIGALSGEENSLPIWIEGDLRFHDLDIKTLGELERLGPFGPGNPEPVFRFEADILSHSVVKDRHLRLRLGDPQDDSVIDAIWFGGAERKDLLSDGQFLVKKAEFAGVPEINRFRGKLTPTLRVRDLHQSPAPDFSSSMDAV